MALRILEKYCIAFNSSFSLVKFLYECNPNPFLSKDGTAVDLTGAAGLTNNSSSEQCAMDESCRLMNENTSIKFSLPSVQQGETEATGLCTIRLLNHLQVCSQRLIR